MVGSRVVAFLLALALASSAVAQEDSASSAVDLELVIAVDVSASMDREEFLLQRRGYIEAIRHPDFVRAILAGERRRIALTYVEWSGPAWQKIIVPWRVIDGGGAAAEFAATLAGEPLVVQRGTSISAAIAFSAGLLESNEYDAHRRVIDVSGDGPNNYGPPVVEARGAAVASDIVVNGLPILIRPSPIVPDIVLYYSDCVIGGAGSFVLPVKSVEEFTAAIRRKLILEVAGGPPARIVPAAAEAPADCRIGEKTRELYADPYYPGLDK